MCRWAYVRGGPCNLLTLLSCTTAWLTAEGNPPHTVAFSELTPPFVKVNPQTMERTQRQVVVFRKRAIRQKGLISLERYKPWRANWRLTLPDACFFRKWYDRDIHVKRLMTRRALHYIDKLLIWDRPCPGLPTLHNRGHPTRPPYYLLLHTGKWKATRGAYNQPELTRTFLEWSKGDIQFKVFYSLSLYDTKSLCQCCSVRYTKQIQHVTLYIKLWKNVTCQQTFTLSNKRKITRVWILTIYFHHALNSIFFTNKSYVSLMQRNSVKHFRIDNSKNYWRMWLLLSYAPNMRLLGLKF